MEEPQKYFYRVVFNSGRWVDVASAWNWETFSLQLLAHGYVMTPQSFAPLHAIESVFRLEAATETTEPQTFPQPIGSA